MALKPNRDYGMLTSLLNNWPTVAGPRKLYLDLLSECLIGRIFEDAPLDASKVDGYQPDIREIGWDWPSRAVSMMGAKRPWRTCVQNASALSETTSREISLRRAYGAGRLHHDAWCFERLRTSRTAKSWPQILFAASRHLRMVSLKT